MTNNAPPKCEDKVLTDKDRIILSPRESQEGIANVLRRAFEAQIPVPRSTAEFDALLARIH